MYTSCITKMYQNQMLTRCHCKMHP